MIRFFKNLLFLFTGKSSALKKQGLPEAARLLLSRRSCRAFTDEAVSPDDLHTILEAGRFAPSTVNLQTWSFITFTPEQWQAAFDRPIPFRAGAAIVVCADTYRLQKLFHDFSKTPYVNLSFAVFNAGLAAMNLTVAAEALGYSSVMLSETGKTGLLDFAHLKEKLALPGGVLPLTTIVLGRPGKAPQGVPPRQPANSVVMPKAYNHRAPEMLSDWFDQMFIGFKLVNPLSSFDRQLEFYRKKMLEAEAEIRKLYEAGSKGNGL